MAGAGLTRWADIAEFYPVAQSAYSGHLRPTPAL